MPDLRKRPRWAAMLAAALTLALVLPLAPAQAAYAAGSTPPPAALDPMADPLSRGALDALSAATAPSDRTGARALGPTQSAAASPIVSTDTTDTTPSYYYMPSNGANPLPPLAFHDAAGVVMKQYAFLPAPVYSPVDVAQRAILCYERHLATAGVDTTALPEFLADAAWLRDNMDADGLIPYTWDYGARGLKGPWYSAMAQGLAISVFMRAWCETHDSAWIDAGRRAFLPMTRQVGSTPKGVTVVEGADLWLEEYPDATPSHVLNGSVFALFGVYDLVRVTGDAEPVRVLAAASHTIATHLHQYERNGAILYELYPLDAYAYGYESVHLNQLAVLSRLSVLADAPTFGSVGTLWAAQFRTYPLPVVTWDQPSLATLYGYKLVLSGTVSSLYRPTLVSAYLQPSGGANKLLTQVTLTPDRNTHVAHYAFTARGFVANTVGTVEVVGDPVTRRAIQVAVGPRIAMAAQQANFAGGRYARLDATVVPGDARLSLTVEKLVAGRWVAVTAMSRVSPLGGRVYWPVKPGMYTFRAHFLGSSAIAPAYSQPVRVFIR